MSKSECFVHFNKTVQKRTLKLPVSNKLFVRKRPHYYNKYLEHKAEQCLSEAYDLDNR